MVEDNLDDLIREASTSPPASKPPVLPDRITFVGFVYHQSVEHETFQVDLGYERLLETQEQVFYRSLRVGEEWQVVIPERCWLAPKDIGLIVIRNNAGRHPRVNPSQKDLKADRSIQVDLGGNVRGNYLQIPRLVSQVIGCTHPELLRMRACAGEIPYTIYLFPR